MTTRPDQPATPAPRLSIGLPVRNGERYLRQALDGLLAQTFRDFEILVSDNQSTDSTIAIVEEFAARDSRVRLVRQAENLGAAGNFNFVFHETHAPLFKWAAYDDEHEPAFLERTIALLDADPGVSIAHCRTLEIDSQGKVTGEFRDQDPLTRATPSARLAGVFAMEYPSPVWGVMRRVQARRTRLQQGYLGSDWNFLGEMMLMGRLGLVPEPLFKVRAHEQQYSTGMQKDSKAARLSWFNPRAKAPTLLSPARAAAHFLRAAWRYPLPLAERFRCMGLVADRYAGKALHKLRKARKPRAQHPSADGTPAGGSR